MTFCTYGDYGDVIYLMPCMKLSSSPVTLYCKDGLRLNDPFTTRIPFLAPLLESQVYIDSVLPWNGEAIDHDASMFRDGGHPFGVTLAELQARWIGLQPELRQPWLKVTPNHWAHIVVNRTTRYRNHFFPWQKLVWTFGTEMVFIGHPHEYSDFCNDFGHIGYLPTENLLKAAEVIAGSELFIGNQSCCYAIAEGLKHRTIQETDLMTPDCVFRRANATYCHDGALDFELLGTRFHTKSQFLIRAHLNETPPQGWRVSISGQTANSYAFDLVVREITEKLQAHGIPVPKDLKEIIIEQNSVGFQDHPVTRLISAG